MCTNSFKMHFINSFETLESLAKGLPYQHLCHRQHHLQSNVYRAQINCNCNYSINCSNLYSISQPYPIFNLLEIPQIPQISAQGGL